MTQKLTVIVEKGKGERNFLMIPWRATVVASRFIVFHN